LSHPWAGGYHHPPSAAVTTVCKPSTLHRGLLSHFLWIADLTSRPSRCSGGGAAVPVAEPIDMSMIYEKCLQQVMYQKEQKRLASELGVSELGLKLRGLPSGPGSGDGSAGSAATSCCSSVAPSRCNSFRHGARGDSFRRGGSSFRRGGTSFRRGNSSRGSGCDDGASSCNSSCSSSLAPSRCSSFRRGVRNNVNNPGLHFQGGGGVDAIGAMQRMLE